MSMTNIAGLGSTKIELEDTYPDDDFEGRATFELREGKIKITACRHRPGGREYAIPAEMDLETLEHIVRVLKGEDRLT